MDAAEHTKLKVRVELEVERRLRIQSALDNAEKRCYASNRLLEKKVGNWEFHTITCTNSKSNNSFALSVVWRVGRQRVGVVGRARELAIASEQDGGGERAVGEDDQGEGGQNSREREGCEGSHVEG